ncbi:MAG: hypothetical protein MPN21_14785 [Thermoanaerobaculia bacterium]|nr:hypothetical protein [Thermoanaerobaculia bacterium]
MIGESAATIAILESASTDATALEIATEHWSSWLLLCLSGCVGGILYSQKSKLEGVRERRGVLIDFLFGIAGAHLVFLLMPAKFEISDRHDLVRYVALAILGGYGAGPLLDHALPETLRRLRKNRRQVEKLEGRFEESQEADRVKERASAEALDLVEKHLDRGLLSSPVDQDKLDNTVSEAASHTKVTVFQRARAERLRAEEALRQADNQEGKEDIIEENREALKRTIGIFDALIKDDREERYHRSRGQLGFALKSLGGSNLRQGIRAFDAAIRLRDRNELDGSRSRHGFLLYELSRAICRIQSDDSYQAQQASGQGVRRMILRDLADSSRAERIRDLIAGSDARSGLRDIHAWMKLNDVEPEDLLGLD